MVVFEILLYPLVTDMISLISLFSPDCMKCSSKHPASICYTHDGMCFLVYCGIPNWFEAFSLCHLYQGELAVLKTKTAIDVTIRNINRRGKLCSNYWIGLSNFRWKFETSGLDNINGK